MTEIVRRLEVGCVLLCTGVGLIVMACGDNQDARTAPPDAGAPSDAAPVAQAPDVVVQASLTDVMPNDLPELKVAGRDGASHPHWSYAFSDGKTGSAQGSFEPKVAADAATQVYTPASCVLLGGGAQAVQVSVTVTDDVTHLTGSASIALTVHCPDATFYTTKTPYHPGQAAASYEPAPAGFSPVFTELVARHGSRGLSSAKYDFAMYAMWQKADADGALTALGQQLGPDVLRVIRANALLDVGVPGLKTPGYGNLTQIGIREHKELAVRLLARLPGYFTELGASGARSIQVISSGVDRAVDSAGFFAGSLATEQPSLASLITTPPAPVGYPANAPVVQPAGTNRFLLYFHKLVAKTDLVSDPADPFYAVYQASQAFQAYAGDAAMTTKVNAILATPDAVTAARAVLERLFTPAFVDKIDNGTYAFANTGSFTFTADGGFTTTVTGDGKTKVNNLTDAITMLYNVYAIAPAMAEELGGDFTAYLPADSARLFAYLQDAQDFYEMGPGVAEAAPVTFQMASALEDDFFHEVDAIAAGDLSHGAVLRFTHAEIIVPFAGILGLAAPPVPLAQTYDYATNRWRGELIAPLAANVQWDVYRNAAGSLIVRMLYNEKQTDFKADCESARVAYRSHFYDYAKLKTCYARP